MIQQAGSTEQQEQGLSVSSRPGPRREPARAAQDGAIGGRLRVPGASGDNAHGS